MLRWRCEEFLVDAGYFWALVVYGRGAVRQVARHRPHMYLVVCAMERYAVRSMSSGGVSAGAVVGDVTTVRFVL